MTQDPKPQAAPREIELWVYCGMIEQRTDLPDGDYVMIEKSAHDALEAENAELRLAEDARWRPTVAKLHMEVAQLKRDLDISKRQSDIYFDDCHSLRQEIEALRECIRWIESDSAIIGEARRRKDRANAIRDTRENKS